MERRGTSSEPLTRESIIMAKSQVARKSDTTKGKNAPGLAGLPSPRARRELTDDEYTLLDVVCNAPGMRPRRAKGIIASLVSFGYDIDLNLLDMPMTKVELDVFTVLLRERMSGDETKTQEVAKLARATGLSHQKVIAALKSLQASGRVVKPKSKAATKAAARL